MTVIRKGNAWAALSNLCWLWHQDDQVVDCDARRVFQRCSACGRESQFGFQAALGPNWIGFCDEVHRCPLCTGWKPRGWGRCGNEICVLNPNGPLFLMPDGSGRHFLGGPGQSE